MIETAGRRGNRDAAELAALELHEASLFPTLVWVGGHYTAALTRDVDSRCTSAAMPVTAMR
jgi:hypothetical protein